MKFEYKTERVELYGSGITMTDSKYYAEESEKKANLERVLNENASKGWRLKLTQSYGQNSYEAILIFEREIAEGGISL